MSADNQLRTLFQAICKNVNEDVDDFIPLKSVSKKYNLQPAHVVLATGGIFAIFTLLGLFQHVMVTIFGLIYPAYMSFKAIEAESEEKCKVWLSYWVVFGSLTAFDRLFALLLFFLPAYYFLKLLLYLWLYYPRTNGALILYEKVLRPQLLRLRDLADKKDQ